MTKIQLRRDTAANWTSVNPVLLEGEVGLELDTGKSKVGDGSTAWNSLAYDLASTALQSHQSLANYVTINTAQTITGVKTFDPNSNAYIKTNQVRSANDDLIFYTGNNSLCYIGYYGRELRLDGSTTRPRYSTDGSTYTNIALYSDIPTTTSDLTNDSGYVTKSDVLFIAEYGTTTYAEITAAITAGKNIICHKSETYGEFYGALDYHRTDNIYYSFTCCLGNNIYRYAVNDSNSWTLGIYYNANNTLSNVSSISSSSAVATALDGKADTDLSNLSATGKTVLDGQWTISTLTIVNSSTTITAGQTLSYKLNTYLPNDNYKYEVMYSAYGETTNTSGAVANIGIGSDVIGADNNGITVQRTRTSSTMYWGVSGIMIINNDSNRYIKIMQRDGNNSCTLSNFKVVAYRRIGTNS